MPKNHTAEECRCECHGTHKTRNCRGCCRECDCCGKNIALKYWDTHYARCQPDGKSMSSARRAQVFLDHVATHRRY